MKLLDHEIQRFINANLHADLHSLLLKKSPFPGVAMQQIVQQIKGKKIAERKFPFLLKKGIIFPPHLNLEQASSQATAEFKAQNLKAGNLLDLTTGFGVDAYFLSRNSRSVTLVEQDAEVLEIVRHNWKTLGRDAVFINADLDTFLHENTVKFDLVYLDPARRDVHQKRKFRLEDLSPNLLHIYPQLRRITSKVLVKLSPLIDISYLIAVLADVSKIEIVAVRNEVKEIVVHLDFVENAENVNISCVNLQSGDPLFNFYFKDESAAKAEFSEPLQFLYMPNTAVLKAGAFTLISEKFKLKKLHPNTHLYTSERLIQGFPGRILEIEKIADKEIRKGEKFNIISKNHPLSAESIKKKYKISDGGNSYLIFTQSQKGKIILRST